MKTQTQAQTAQIIGQGTLAANGLPFVLVTSGSEPGRSHCVSYCYEGVYIGSRMHCDCKGYTYRGHCRHAQLVADWLAAGLAAGLAALGLPYPPQAPETPDAYEQAQADVQDVRRDLAERNANHASVEYGARSAPRQSLLNRTQAFSLMK